MKLPFTTAEFLAVFRQYNEAIWPLQIVFFFLALILLAVIYKTFHTRLFVPFALSFLWFWMGYFYHLLFFTAINNAAYLFAAAFILQSILFLVFPLIWPTNFALKWNPEGVMAISLVTYALIIYPLIGYFSDHPYPYQPTFGLPCPSTIFTFGVLLLSKEKLPFYTFLIPQLWAVVGSVAALKMGVYEDIGLPVAAILFVVVEMLKRGNWRVGVKHHVKAAISERKAAI